MCLIKEQTLLHFRRGVHDFFLLISKETWNCQISACSSFPCKQSKRERCILGLDAFHLTCKLQTQDNDNEQFQITNKNTVCHGLICLSPKKLL